MTEMLHSVVLKMKITNHIHTAGPAGPGGPSTSIPCNEKSPRNFSLSTDCMSTLDTTVFKANSEFILYKPLKIFCMRKWNHLK